MAKVFANGRSILHAGDGLKHASAVPDVCKSPSPAGPAPVPYVNLASDSNLAEGTKKTKISGKSVALKSSNIKTSSGDEPGTAGGGLVSAKTKGKMTWGSASANVKFEGKGVARFMDATHHNGNSYNAAFTSLGGTGLAYADDFQGKCGICRKGPAAHRILDTPSSGILCQQIVAAMREHFATGAVTGWEKKKWKQGLMVGVMVCKHDPPRSFATVSGTTPPVFTEIAGRIVDQVVDGGPAEFEDFVAANQSRTPCSRVRSNLEEALRLVNEGRANPDTRRRYNTMGQCAGAKLVARAGHAPLNMTEMFYRAVEKPDGPWTVTYSVISNDGLPADAWRTAILDNALSRRSDRNYDTSGSVASCETCQATLYMTMCPERTC